MMIQVLHLSDVAYMANIDIEALKRFLVEKKMQRPNILLVAGITRAGDEAEFKAIQKIMASLIAFLSIKLCL